jgi:DNA repair ATPase RecN
MAKEADKDILARLADAGEDALRRLGEAPGMDRAMTYARTTRKQIDELTKRVQGISALEARIAKLEKQVAALSKESSSKRSPARKAPPTAGP